MQTSSATKSNASNDAISPAKTEIPETNVDKKETAKVTSAIHFEDVSSLAKLSNIISTGFDRNFYGLVEILGAGVAVADYDRDGELDLFFAGGGTFSEDKHTFGLPGELYRGLGGFEFTMAGKQSGFDTSRYYSHATIVADINGDGFCDCLVTGYRGLQCFINQGDGTFQEVASSIGLDDTQWSTGGALADINNDGNLDLFISRYSNIIVGEGPVCRQASDPSVPASCSPAYFPGLKDSLYLVSKDGRFSDVTDTSGVVDAGRGLGVVAADFDEDGAIDIYVANDTERNHFYRNDGRGGLTEIGVRAGVATDSRGVVQGSMGVTVGDSNNDGKLDLLVVNYERELPALYRNRGKLLFRFDSLAAKIGMLGPTQSSWGTEFVDFDNDGDEDIVVISGHVEPARPSYEQLPSLLENSGDGAFRDVSNTVGDFFREPRPGRGLATGDFNHDGKVDFVSTNIDQPNMVLKNSSKTTNPYIHVDLVGTISNRDAIGAIVTLESGDKKWVHHRYGGGSFISTSQSGIHFGVPTDSALPAKLSVRWPSGAKSEQTVERWNEKIYMIEPK